MKFNMLTNVKERDKRNKSRFEQVSPSLDLQSSSIPFLNPPSSLTPLELSMVFPSLFLVSQSVLLIFRVLLAFIALKLAQKCAFQHNWVLGFVACHEKRVVFATVVPYRSKKLLVVTSHNLILSAAACFELLTSNPHNSLIRPPNVMILDSIKS